MSTTKATKREKTPVQCTACGGDHDSIDCENVKCPGCDKHPYDCICEKDDE